MAIKKADTAKAKRMSSRKASCVLPAASSNSAFNYYAENAAERKAAAQAFVQATETSTRTKKPAR